MKNVWLVDDDEEMAQAVSLMLSLIECQIRIFRDARSAAQALLAGDFPDLVLLDINLPEVSGLDLLEFIRRRRTWQRLPVLMISTEATDAQIDRALELGADGYLVKPVTIAELEEAIKGALNRQES
jgi:DNA-binding response OmpR family regulator